MTLIVAQQSNFRADLLSSQSMNSGTVSRSVENMRAMNDITNFQLSKFEYLCTTDLSEINGIIAR